MPSGRILRSRSAWTSSTRRHTHGRRAGEREAAAVGARLARSPHEHGQPVEVHEVHVLEVEDHAAAPLQLPVHGLPHPGSGHRVDLALNAHDHDSTVIVE